MATAADLRLRLSGGASNSDPLLSVGGAMSSTPASGSLFDDVSGGEASVGDVEYRCIYLYNANATDTLSNNRVYIGYNTPSPATHIEIGLGAADTGDAEDPVANEDTAPVGVTFFEPTTLSAGLLVASIAPGSYKSVWIKRTVTAGAQNYTGDGFRIRWSAQTSVAGGGGSSGTGYFGADYFSAGLLPI